MTSLIDFITPLLAGKDLTRLQAGELLNTVFTGDVPECQIAAFLTAMRIKGPTPTEIAGLAGSLRSHAVKINVKGTRIVDTCGTGGGAIKTCNVSTASAMVAAGAGVTVAKHGNRGITSKCGSADVLEALGVKIDASPKVISECIQHAGIGFMLAPLFHPAMKYVQPVRKSLGFRTVFNILGPLANPAGAHAQVLGVADLSLMETMVESLKCLGTQFAMVVHSDGLDEISTLGPTQVMTLNNGQITAHTLNPEDLGIPIAKVDDLKADDVQGNAKALHAVFEGQNKGAKYDIITLNAAAAIIAGGLAETFESGLTLAKESIDQGKALMALNKLIEISNR